MAEFKRYSYEDENMIHDESYAEENTVKAREVIKELITKETVNIANGILEKYKQGKASKVVATATLGCNES